ncbi:MAG: phasin family protein [Magnetococcales bacterium]|nr:phasin family protein [Magnetococcales bacterium]
MDKKVAEQVAHVTKKMMDSIVGMQSLNERIMKDIARQQVSAAESFVSVSSRQLKGLAKLKSVREAVNAQADIAADVGKIMAENAQQTLLLLARGQEEIRGLIYRELNEVWNMSGGGTVSHEGNPPASR